MLVQQSRAAIEKEKSDDYFLLVQFSNKTAYIYCWSAFWEVVYGGVTFVEGTLGASSALFSYLCSWTICVLLHGSEIRESNCLILA